jgi:hypothetical protein
MYDYYNYGEHSSNPLQVQRIVIYTSKYRRKYLLCKNTYFSAIPSV